ncbi:MAG: biotin--[acetyl-CoA-carboxylase] ligase, partial [Candidatus Omnitrophica bacterium]|nr:biotin--[acetyl-CoA-carboxylase] ligase [Candidatus Omnitrophota bacterium]
LLRPKSLLLSEITQISLIISLACLKGIKETTGIDCQVKWPNDILVSGKKLGGVLCEINAEADRVLFLIAGVGININSKDLPSGATSLHLYAKKKFRRLDITQEIIRQIEAAYLKVQQGESGELLAEWSKSCILWGKHLELKLSGKIIEGTAVNIDDKGYLILRVDNGTQHKVSAGDIVKVRSCR